MCASKLLKDYDVIVEYGRTFSRGKETYWKIMKIIEVASCKIIGAKKVEVTKDEYEKQLKRELMSLNDFLKHGNHVKEVKTDVPR